MRIFQQHPRQHQAGFLSAAEVPDRHLRRKVCETKRTQNGRRMIADRRKFFQGPVEVALERGIVWVGGERQGQRLDLSLQLLRGNGIQVKGRLKRLLLVEGQTLGKVPDPQVGARRYDRPGVGRFDTGQDTHKSGFAAAVGADQPHALAVADAERDIVQDRLNAVRFVNMVSGKHRNL